jgi:hypothetical protein
MVVASHVSQTAVCDTAGVDDQRLHAVDERHSGEGAADRALLSVGGQGPCYSRPPNEAVRGITSSSRA